MMPSLGECNIKYTITPFADGKYIILKVKGKLTGRMQYSRTLRLKLLGKYWILDDTLSM